MPTVEKDSELTCTGVVFNKLTKQLGKPVDFELPAWFIKSNPWRYITIKRNKYLSEKAKRQRFDDDGIFCTCTPSPDSPNACGRDCHCELLLSSCSKACKCKGTCLNKPFQDRAAKKIKKVKTEKCGSGIVAAEDIKRGEFVVEYVGEVIDDLICEERLWILKHRGETNFYLCEINRDMVIDATYKGNKSRYINHSCCPNTEMQKWISNGETRIGIFATQDIQKGEHLTYDYQFVQFGADQDCHCGAVGCRRKLGVRSTKSKKVACQVYWDGSLQIGISSVVDQSNCLQICIGEVITIKHLGNARFGIIKWVREIHWLDFNNFDEYWSLGATVRLLPCDLQTWRSRVLETASSQSGVRLCTSALFRPHLVGASCTEPPFIMFEDDSVGIHEMSRGDWEFVRL